MDERRKYMDMFQDMGGGDGAEQKPQWEDVTVIEDITPVTALRPGDEHAFTGDIWYRGGWVSPTDYRSYTGSSLSRRVVRPIRRGDLQTKTGVV